MAGSQATDSWRVATQQPTGKADGTGSSAALINLARRSLLLTAVLGLVALLVAAFALTKLRSHHLQATERNLQHVAYGIAEQTAHEIGQADRTLTRFVDAARLDPPLLRDPLRRAPLMGRNLDSVSTINAIAYSEENGQRHYYGGKLSAAPASALFPSYELYDGINVVAGAEREPAGVYLQRTVWPAGAPGATLVMRISEQHLLELFKLWRGTAPTAVSLTTTDGRPLLRYPVSESALGGANTAEPSAGEMLIATHRTPGYPLVVQTVLPKRQALATWTSEALILLGTMVALILTALVIARRHAAELGRRAAALDELQSVQSALALEEAKLQGMFRTALECIAVIDERGTIERVNPATEHTFGYAASELIGRNISVLMPAREGERHNGYIERYLESGVPHIIGTAGREVTARHRDGTEFPVHLSVAEQQLGGLRCFTGTMRDITQEKLSDSLLRAETRIARLLATAPRVDTVATDIVKALCELGFAYGHWATRDPASRNWRVHARWIAPDFDFDPEKISAFSPEVTPPSPTGILNRAWQTGEVSWRTHLEEQEGLPRARAAVAAGLNSSVAIPIHAGDQVVSIIELACARQDPRNHTLDNALRNIGVQLSQLLSRLNAEAELETIVRTVPSAVFQAKVGERRTVALTYMSAQIEGLWGVSARSVLARPRQVLWRIPPAYRRDLLRALSRAVIRASGWDVTVPLVKDGSTRWMRVHAAPAFKRGELPVWDGIISDVTDQKVAEQQVVRLNLDLERRVEERTQQLAMVNKELEAFSESVSHDLRAPLRGMRSFADMLRQTQAFADPTARTMIDRIVSQGEQMESLIEALLELSQISRHELRRKETDLSAIATAVLEGLAARDPQRRVQRTVAKDLRADADPRLMRVLLENLLSNAWKFTRKRDDARIEFGTLPDADDTYFVRDNGAGFDPAYADKLFQPFQRLHPASQFEGTGIGLATVQRIVRRHGGRIWAESAPGAGATFFFEIPADDDPHYTPRP